MVYVDGNSPPAVRRHVEEQATVRGFSVLRHDEYLTPNTARNRAAAQVRTRYVAFIDNDVLVTPGWLERLVQCAEETGAWAVGPLYCQGEPAGTCIHMAGGTAHFYEQAGERFFEEEHLHYGQHPNTLGPLLQRGPIELLEFHCMLLRMEVFERFGRLDEQLPSLHEHIDVCLAIREAGRPVFLEPTSSITYVGPLPLAATDRDYFSLRWSDAWNRQSIAHFQQKWQVSPNDPSLADALAWGEGHRLKAQTAWCTLLRPLGRHRANRFIGRFERRHNQLRYPFDGCAPGGPFSGGRLSVPAPRGSSESCIRVA